MGDRKLFRGGRTRSDVAEEAAPSAPVAAAEVPANSPQAVDDSCVRKLLTITGVISDVTLGSRGDSPALEATLDFVDPEDGLARRVVLVWLGRREISGIHAGRAIIATARISDESGTRVMYNPRYDLR